MGSAESGVDGKTQAGDGIIRSLVWWTTIAISAAAAWFEWQYRRHRARQRKEEDQEEVKPEEAVKKPATRDEALLSASEKSS